MFIKLSNNSAESNLQEHQEFDMTNFVRTIVE